MTLDTLVRRTVATAIVLGTLALPTSAYAQQRSCDAIRYTAAKSSRYVILNTQLLTQHPDGFTILVGTTDARDVNALDKETVRVESAGGSFVPEPTLLEQLTAAGFKAPLGGVVYRAYCQ